MRTKKKEFLAQIERIIPWGEWTSIIRSHYYKGERGNKPYDLERMLRLYILQNLYHLSDEGTVAEVIDSRAFSAFCGVDSSNQIPNGDTLGRFRSILVSNKLQEKLFAQVVQLLVEKGLILKKGTIVDSSIIAAPSSTKNKGNTASFGKSDFVRKIVSECGAETQEYWMYSKFSQQNSGAVFPESAADAVVRCCLRKNSVIRMLIKLRRTIFGILAIKLISV